MEDRKKVKLNDAALAALKTQNELFVKKFGREPGPNDPLFFDPDSDVPVPMSEDQLASLLRKLGAALEPT